MRRPKQYKTCKMPECKAVLKVLVLNASLKHEPGISNTGELAQKVLENIKVEDKSAETEIMRLADKKIPVGLGYKEGDDDDWPDVAAKIKAADILIFATPIWWGGRSSLMQRIIERLDSLDEDYLKSGRSVLYNKVAGIVITGSEVGALSTMGSIMMVLSWFGFTLPPECACYWVGEVGQNPKEDREKRLQNKATDQMAKILARNLVYYSKLLKNNPLIV